MKFKISIITLTALISCTLLQATFIYDPKIDPEIKSYIENILAPIEKEFASEEIHIKKSNRFATNIVIPQKWENLNKLTKQIIGLEKFPQILYINEEEIKKSSLESSKFSIYHELGHMKNKHSQKRYNLLISQKALRTALYLYILHKYKIEKIIPSILIASGFPRGNTLLYINPLYYNYCKKHEYQADAYAYQNVKSINTLRERLSDNKYMDNFNWLEKTYSTHPTYNERIAALEKIRDLEQKNQEQI